VDNTTYQCLQSHSSASLELLRCRAPSFASATEKSRAAAVVQPACPKLGLVVYGTSIDRWCASRRWTAAMAMVLLHPALPLLLRTAARRDMIPIAHLASHLSTPGSRVADLNGEMVCFFLCLLSCCLDEAGRRPYHRSRIHTWRWLRLRAISRNLVRLNARAGKRHYSITDKDSRGTGLAVFSKLPSAQSIALALERSRPRVRGQQGHGVHTAQA
jgi:hypothetical protein